MIDFNSGTSMLAVGGIAAAVAAGWSHVKGAFSYLSSFIVVTAKLDDTSTSVIRRQLRQHWKLLPSGQLVYRARYLMFKGHNYSSIVPFELPAHTAVYRRGLQFLFVSGTSEGMAVSFVRGTVNFKEVLKEAITTFEIRVSEQENNPNAKPESRYQIVQQIGSEKGAWAQFAPRDSSVPTSSGNSNYATAEVSANGAATSVYLDQSEDKSFMYDKSMWMFDSTEDPFSSLYFPSEIMMYIEQARQWLRMAKWYTDRMIPHRRGWLLHGPGGTGKTSLAKATAQELGIPIYQYFLSTLSDQEFIQKWNAMTAPCVALLEDFDSVFNLRDSTTDHKALTFDCILNQISGASTVNGVFLIVTTNHIEKIDPAMGVSWGEGKDRKNISTRPGRIDTVIEVGNIDRVNRHKLATRILRDWPECIDELVDSGDGVTPAQFQEMLVQKAYQLMNDPVASNVINLAVPQTVARHSS